MIPDNPAHRLWMLLTEAHQIQGSINCKSGWAQLLGVDSESPELFTRMGKVMQLPADAMTALEIEHADELPMARHWQTQINRAFARQNFRENWSSFIGNVDEHSLNYLRTHAKLINDGKQLKPLQLDTLDNARTQLAELIQTVLKDEGLDPTVRLELIRNLRRLVSSLEEYKVTGSTAVFESISVLYGHGMFNPEYRAAVKPDTSIGKTLGGVVAGLADAMTIVLGLEPISHVSKQLLSLAQNAV